jgi:hypothetical protein
MPPLPRLSLLLFAPLAALAAESSSATPRATPAPTPAADGDTIELSPFVVNVEKDRGYAATTTLSGTRLATDLRDTAGSLSIMTPELMADLNVTSVAEAVLFFPSGNEDFGAPIGGGTQAGNNGMANPGTRKIRGISTWAASRNFFPVAGQVDLYNSERLTSANGPNSILFGTSGVEGVTVTSTKQARTDRTHFSASAKVDSNGSRRGALDFNWAASAKFALRLNALSADDRGFRDNEIKVQRRLNLAATVKPFRHTTLRADHENFSIKTNVVPLKWAMDSGYQSWLTGGSPLITTPVSGAWTAAQRNQYSSVLSQNGVGLVFMGNTAGLPATLNTRFLASTIERPFGNGSVAAYQVPDPVATYGIARDATLTPATKAYPGNTQTGSNTSIFLEQRITTDFYVELAANHTRENTRQRNFIMDGIKIDPNRFLADGTLNPGYQKLYAEGSPRQGTPQDENLGCRVTASYDLKPKGRASVLGRHRFAGLWETNHNTSWTNQEFVVNTIVDGANGLNTDPLNAQHRLSFRSYYTPQNGDVRPYPVYAVFENPALADVTNSSRPGNYLYKFSTELTQAPGITEKEQESRALVWQGHLLQDRLVATYGLRRDTIDNWTLRAADTRRKAGTPYFLNTREYDIPGGQAPDTTMARMTHTLGLVGHVTKWLSFTYNQSEVFNPAADVANLYSADGTPLPPETGETEEYGLRLYLLDNRLTFSLSRFEAATRNTSQFNPANNTFIGPRNTVYALMQRNWAGTGLVADIPPESIIQINNVRGLTDTALSGWEMTAVFNPTRNWRLLLTGSVNKTIESNRYAAIKTLIADDLKRMAVWSARLTQLANTAGNPTVVALAAADLITVDARLVGLTTALADANATEGRDLASVGKYALNAVASYGFSEGALAGWRVTGRGRYRSAPIIGYYRDANRLIQVNRPYRGAEIFDVGAQVGRTLKLYQRPVEVRLDVANLFDFDQHLPQLADTDDFGVFGTPREMRVVRWALQRPRTYTLSVDVKF